MIEYRNSPAGITHVSATGFFVGWPVSPSDAYFRRILENSYAYVIAYDLEHEEIIGFATAISDGFFSAFIPLIEVKSGYRNRGIGKNLLAKIEEGLAGVYSIDAVCDEDVKAFYGRAGYIELIGNGKRFRNALEG